MLFQLVLVIVIFVSGIGVGVWLTIIAGKWMSENKEPSPGLVRDRKELLTTLFVVICLSILIIGIITKDRSPGLALVAISVVPILFLCFELLQPRHEDAGRGYNAVGYFIINVVLYGAVRAFDGFPGTFESINSLFSVSFLHVMFVMFVVDVFFSGMQFIVSSDSEDLKAAYMRAVPVFGKSYTVMLAILGLLLIVSN